MANPVLIDIDEGKWNLIATGVTTGMVHRKSEEPNLYFQTYRLTGEAAPTTLDEGIKLFINSVISEPISAVAAVDVYVWPVGSNGRVRVDL